MPSRGETIKADIDAIEKKVKDLEIKLVNLEAQGLKLDREWEDIEPQYLMVRHNLEHMKKVADLVNIQEFSNTQKQYQYLEGRRKDINSSITRLTAVMDQTEETVEGHNREIEALESALAEAESANNAVEFKRS
jgi:chromosome segregation ATPase